MTTDPCQYKSFLRLVGVYNDYLARVPDTASDKVRCTISMTMLEQDKSCYRFTLDSQLDTDRESTLGQYRVRFSGCYSLNPLVVLVFANLDQVFVKTCGPNRVTFRCD